MRGLILTGDQRLTSRIVPITIEATRQAIRIAIATFQIPGIGGSQPVRIT